MLDQILSTEEQKRIRKNLQIAIQENLKFRNAEDPDGIIYAIRNELEHPTKRGYFIQNLNRQTYEKIKQLGFQEGYEPHIYKSNLWRKAKIYYLLLFGNLAKGYLECQVCHRKYWKWDQLGLCNQYQFVIHHTYYQWRLFFDPRCILLVCYPCHKRIHTTSKSKKKAPLHEVSS